MAGDLLIFAVFALLAALIVVPAILVMRRSSVRRRYPLMGTSGALSCMRHSQIFV